MEDLEKSKAQVYLENILKRVPGSIYWKDVKGVYLGCNQMQAEMAGFKSPAEVIGKTDYDLPWKEIADRLKETDERIMTTHKAEEVIETPVLPSGTTLIMLTNKAPLYDETGKVIGIIGTSLDITDLIRAKEKEKEALMTAAASEAKRKIDLETKRAVMILAGSIAHDLRTPLLMLTLINQQLKNLLSPEEQQSGPSLDKIKKIPGKIEDTIKDMHLFIDHNLKALKHSTSASLKEETLVECKSYRGIQDALDAYPFTPQEKDLIEVDKSYFFDFLGNPILFLRILFNLLSNSLYQIHYNKRGKIFISCEEEGDFNLIRFKDTAGGASPPIVENIFEGYKTTKEKGTGVGLAFCRLTMESFGGNISCYSKEGDFIEFILKFPKIRKKL